MQIYINKDGQQYGPYTVEQLQQYVQQGHFTPQDYACHDGQNWITVEQVPGFAGGGQAAAAQPQAQQAAQQPAQAQAATQPQQAAAAVTAVDAAAKKKKIILWSSIGVAAALVVAGILVAMSGDDEEEVEEVATAKTDQESSGSKPVDPAPNNPTKPNNPNVLSGHDALQLVPLIERIPADALGVATLDWEKVLQKGGPKAASFIQAESDSDAGRFESAILKDPSSIGLDASEPVRAYFLTHPTKPDDDDLTIGIAAKLEDSAKLKQFLQSMRAPDPTESKDGYDFYELHGDEAYLALAPEFLFFIVNDDLRAGAQHLTKELERFMTSDGSNSLVETHPAIRDLESKGNDLSVWVNLEKIGSMAEGEAPDELLGLVEGGTLSGGLRFDDGEVVLEFDGASKGLGKALGGGGVSSNLTKYLSSDAPLLASISMKVDGLVGFFEDTLAQEADVDLDEPIEQFGIAPREVLDVFQGDFALSLFKIPPLLGGGESVEDVKVETSPDQNQSFPVGEKGEAVDPGDFGDKGDAGPVPNPFADKVPAKPDPFGATSPGQPEIAIDPPAGANPFGGPRPGGFGEGPPGGFDEGPPGGFGEGPPGGPPPGGGPGGIPDFVDLVLAASIDDAKWSALMQKSPQLAGILGLAQLMGITVKAENGVLAVGTPKRAAAVAGGGLPNAVSGSAKTLFTSHDFAIQLKFDSLAEQWEFEPEFENLFKEFDSLAISAKSQADGGNLTVRLALTDKRTNSLPALIDIVMKYLPSLSPLSSGGDSRAEPADSRAEPSHGHEHGHGHEHKNGDDNHDSTNKEDFERF